MRERELLIDQDALDYLERTGRRPVKFADQKVKPGGEGMPKKKVRKTRKSKKCGCGPNCGCAG